MTTVTTPAKVARNLTRSLFEIGHKHCNSNDRISMSEICARELRATLLGNQPDWKPTHETTYQHTRRRCDGRRRAQRARAGFEIDHSEPSASRVAISRTAGPDGAQKTSGATSTTTPLGRRKGRAAAETARRPLHPLRGTAPVMSRCTRYGARHPLWGAAPVMGRCTRSEGVHCLRIGCSAPNHKNKRGICETTADTQKVGERTKRVGFVATFRLVGAEKLVF